MSNTFILDGNEIPFDEGDTIMDAALKADHYIPHLCHHPDLTPHGSCRLCMVEVNGRTLSSCTTPAANNLQVSSENESLRHLRKRLLQMLFIEGNHICPSCEQSGQCHLQGLAYSLDMEELYFTPQYPKRTPDASHAELFVDLDRCINCALCVRAATEIDHKSVFGFTGRGIHSRLVATSDSGKLADTSISATDKAAHICPVGCILPKQGNFQRPIGSRLYDKQPINLVGNLRPEDQ